MKHSSKKSVGVSAKKPSRPNVTNIGGPAKPIRPRFTGKHTKSGTSRQGSY